MTKIKTTLQGIYRSFPFQLGLAHLQHNLLLLSIYAFLIMLVFGQVGKTYGFHYLFLKPLYLDNAGFLSFLLIGVSLGWMTINWNLTTYILHSHRFPFLATLERPFIKFSFNNFFFPFVFLLVYIYAIWDFDKQMELSSGADIFIDILGLLAGNLLILGILTLYFRYTNKDLNREIKLLRNIQKKVESTKKERNRLEQVFRNFKEGKSQRQVDFFVTERGKVRPVRDVQHYSEEEMLKIFRHNHSNIISFQLLSILVLFFSGIFAENPLFQIPAASSSLLLFSLLISLFGAMTYWFSRWRTLAFIIFLVLWNQLSKQEVFNHLAVAYGIDYSTKADYSLENFERTANFDQFQKDKQATINILDQWKSKNSQGSTKPKLLIFSSSGGGLKSAVWTFKVLQALEEMTDRPLMDQTALMLGASGGMFGQAYFRGLYNQSLQDPSIDLQNPEYLEDLREDLLNAVLFTYVSTDLFMPLAKREVNGEKQPLDRAYAFEKRLNDGTNGIFDVPLSYFKTLEDSAKLPVLLTNPSIVNDGRSLYVSSIGVSYMMANPVYWEKNLPVNYDGVDFGLIFKEQNASNLRYSSALRMNASFPYVLPNVNLPSEPGIQVLDAGLRDNFGLKATARFIHVFEDWIKENTSGVVIVELRAFARDEKINSLENEGVFDGLLNPLALAGDIVRLQNYENDNYIGFLHELLGEDMLEHISFICTSAEEKVKVPISLNLSKREYEETIDNLERNPANQEALSRFKACFK
jgi:hypothetical protein